MNGMTITELVNMAHGASKDKGFWDDEPEGKQESTFYYATKIALMHSELSEALEELRAGRPDYVTYYSEGGKPEGVPSELADTVIRIADYCGARGIDLESIINEKLGYNVKSRGYKHGKGF